MERYSWERGKNRILIFDSKLGHGDGYNDTPIAWTKDVDTAQKIVDALNATEKADDRS